LNGSEQEKKAVEINQKINAAYQGGDLSIEDHRDRGLRAVGDRQEESHKLSNRRDQSVNRDLAQSKIPLIMRIKYERSPPTSCLDLVEAIVQLRQALLVVQALLPVFEQHILRYPLQLKPDHLFSTVYHGDKLAIQGASQARKT